MRRWAWWQAGVCLGIVSWLSIVICRPISVSSGYGYIDALLLRIFRIPWGEVNPYLSRYQRIDFWLIGVLLGLVVAGALPVRVEGGKTTDTLKKKHSRLQAVVGGVVMLAGARLAGGCTSGHLIGGLALLSVSGIVFAIGVFIGGIPVARWLTGQHRGRKR